MSQEGLDKLKKELAEALAQRPVIAAAIAEAREKGDLSENAEYESAREAQGLLELKIAKLQNQVVNAKVLDSSQLNCDQVQMLNTVKVENLANHRVMEFTIVGESEADFSKGKLAATTPIGKALMGHAKGEVVEAKVEQPATISPAYEPDLKVQQYAEANGLEFYDIRNHTGYLRNLVIRSGINTNEILGMITTKLVIK